MRDLALPSGCRVTPWNILVTGGFEPNFSVGFAKGLKANGVQVLAISCDDSEVQFTAAGIEHLNLRGSLKPDRTATAKFSNLLGYYIRLFLFLCRHRGATVHYTGIFRNRSIVWEGLVVNLCFRLLAGHYIYTVHNLLPHGREHSWFFRSIYRFIYRIPQVLLVHTKRTRDKLIADFGVASEKIWLTSIGLNEEMPVSDLSPAEARKKLACEVDDKLILFFGKIDEYKGLECLLEAFDQLASPETRLVIAGEFRHSAYRARILEKLSSMLRAADVRLHEGFIPNAQAEVYFKGCDVLCLPYRHIDQSGLVFLAARFGLPIVATDVGAMRDFVDADMGLVADGREAADLAEALRKYLQSPECFSRVRIMHLARRYEWTAVCRALVPLYAADPSRSGCFDGSPADEKEPSVALP